jgi:hypothetical protein
MYLKAVRRIFYTLFVGLALIGVISDARAQGTANSKYIRDEPDNKTLIVFVHGWTGDSIQTWTNPKTGEYWPNLLRTDKAFSGMNIFVLEYPPAKPEGGLTITDISQVLYERLLANRIMSYDKVIFLAHSLGGLTVRQMLLDRRDLAEKVAFLFFFGTPTEGSGLARIGKYLSHDPVIPALGPIDGTGDSYLSVMINSWKRASFPFKTYCAFERLKTSKFGFASAFVVTETSATALCEDSTPIAETHEDMVKPGNTLADPYIIFKNVLPKYMRSSGTHVDMVDVKRTVDASRIKCDPKGGQFDEVDIDDELHFVDSPPAQYLARAEEMKGDSVNFYDLANNSEPAPEVYKSGDVTYLKAKVGVKDEYAKVRYAWKNAHSGDQIEVWSRPSAVLRDFSATLKLPPTVTVKPKSILPHGTNCVFSDENKTVLCTKLLSRDEPIIITWDWDAWKACKVPGKTRTKK